MKNRLRSFFALLALVPAALFAAEKSAAAKSKNCGCVCCKGKEVCCCNEAKSATEAAPAPDAAKRHPLNGVIVEIHDDQSALLVKHEPIPGFMPAMTMLFKVDAPTLKVAGKGQAIAATLVERDGDFWLEAVHPAVPATKAP